MSSAHQVMTEQHLARTSSPSERPASRLDISRLQQRSNAAAAAAAAGSPTLATGTTTTTAAATVSSPGALTTAPAPEAHDVARHQPRMANLVQPRFNRVSMNSPQLVQPRPEIPPRTFSGNSTGVATSHSASPGRLTPISPSAGTALTSAGLEQPVLALNSDFNALKPDGYPFPATRPPSASPLNAIVDRSIGDRSSVARQSPRRAFSPQQADVPPRFRLSTSSSTPARASTASPSRMIESSETMRRLLGLETAVDELMKGLTSVAQNVGWLMEREKERVSAFGPSAPVSSTNDDVKALGQQVAVLSNSVQQLMALQQQKQRSGGPYQNQGSHRSAQAQNSQLPFAQMAGLGLNNGASGHHMPSAPHQPGVMAPPLLSAAAQGPFGGHASLLSPSNFEDRAISPSLTGVLSPSGLQPIQDGRASHHRTGPPVPRPASRNTWIGSPGPEGQGSIRGDRRWTASTPQAHLSGTPRRDSAIAANVVSGGPSTVDPGSSSVLPSDPPAIITKWEHLNLQPELLRSVLKYGLGPPNKVQQRALPFLLRGSDIIAQAPPTQERIASYVIPALHRILDTLRNSSQGHTSAPQVATPVVLIVTTTVDQATQAQRMALGLGSHLGVRVHLSAGGVSDCSAEAQAITQSRPHILVGTPSRMSDLVTFVAAQGNEPNAARLTGVRMVVLDEVDQMIARNLSDHISTMLRALPQLSLKESATDPGMSVGVQNGLPPSSSGASHPFAAQRSAATMERQTAIFSNTVPQDVLNFAQSIHLRESVRVLVRREGTSVTQHPPTASNIALNAANGGHGSSHQKSAGRNSSEPLGQTSKDHNVDASLSAFQSLRQFYLYIALGDSRLAGNGPFSPHASGEMKLEVIADLLEDMEFHQAVIYTGSPGALEAVTYKLASRGIEALALHRDMAHSTRQQAIANFRSPIGSFGPFGTNSGHAGDRNNRQRKALVAYDVAIHPREVHQVPLVLFFDLPNTVNDYLEKLSCAVSGGVSRPSVCINVVGSGEGGSEFSQGGQNGEIEMLKAIESQLGCKIAELPLDAKTILNS